jgi:hypothetical protein
LCTPHDACSRSSFVTGEPRLSSRRAARAPSHRVVSPSAGARRSLVWCARSGLHRAVLVTHLYVHQCRGRAELHHERLVGVPEAVRRQSLRNRQPAHVSPRGRVTAPHRNARPRVSQHRHGPGDERRLCRAPPCGRRLKEPGGQAVSLPVWRERTQPRSAMAAWTLTRVESDTDSRAFSTAETVPTATPARRATSASLGRDWRAVLLGGRRPVKCKGARRPLPPT